MLDGVGTATFVFSIGRFGLCCAFISSNLGLTTKKKRAAKAPAPSKRNTSTPAMINGSFDFFFATAGNGADGATAACAGAAISPVVARGGSAAGVGGAGGGVTGGGGGGGGATYCGGAAGGGVAEISEVLGVDEVGPVVGPVLRGSATVAG